MSDYENTMSFQLRAQNTLAKPDSHATKFFSYSHAPNRRFNQTKERERERKRLYFNYNWIRSFDFKYEQFMGLAKRNFSFM